MQAGGQVAILDLDEETGQAVARAIGGGNARFFKTNVLETESVSKAVNEAVSWARETGKAIGGVVAAAGVAHHSKVSPHDSSFLLSSRYLIISGASASFYLFSIYP